MVSGRFSAKLHIENGKPPTYLVSFKGKDIDVMTEAFREFTAKKLGRDKKPSIRKLLDVYKRQPMSSAAAAARTAISGPFRCFRRGA